MALRNEEGKFAVAKVLLGLFAAASLGACASVPSPLEDISRAELAVRKADESLASRYAPLHLVKAREKLEKARTASRDEGRWTLARQLALQSQVDAQLAEETARAAQAEERAEEMRQSVASLKAETERNQRRR